MPLNIEYKQEVGIDDTEQAPDIPTPATDLMPDDINKMKVVEMKS